MKRKCSKEFEVQQESGFDGSVGCKRYFTNEQCSEGVIGGLVVGPTKSGYLTLHCVYFHFACRLQQTPLLSSPLQ